MTPERFRQVRNLFEAALEREAPARAAFLVEACQSDEPLREEVERLLAAHEKETAPVDHPAVRPELLTGEAGKMEGRRIDHYEILRELGRGGMGAVYLAVRTDDVYRKPVAFKVVRPEASSQEVIERFRREREILASLDHPNLARLLDGGTTPEGLPYFVMDHIEGKPIGAYCDERQLDIAQRLQLFRSVCSAVEYAHGKGVVHRDLKPSNVLVTADGVVKLLDFGIAKMLRAEGDESTVSVMTSAGMQLMTPEYASPEQVRGEAVGTATDIYSLGVILYELLTGHRPYRMRSRLIHEIVRVICEEEPTRPSTAVTETEERQTTTGDKPAQVTPQSVSRSRADSPDGLRRQLSGDLDKIVLKALRKGPEQRYRTAEAFGEDVRRHLEGLPVEARAQSLVYRAGKLAGRYRAWILGSGAVLLGIATGAVKLSPVAIGFLLLFGVLLLYGYQSMAKYAGSALAFRWLFWIAAGTAAISIVIVRLGNAFRSFVSPSGLFGALVTSAFMFVAGIVAVDLGLGPALWPLRERWAGALLADIGRKTSVRDKIFAVLMGVLALLYPILLNFGDPGLAASRGSRDPFWGFEMTPFYLTAILVFLLRGRAEVRGYGIIAYPGPTPWSAIHDYRWKREGNNFVLEVSAARWALSLASDRRLGPPRFHTCGVAMPEAQMQAVDAVIRAQLANWPGAGYSAQRD